MSIILLLSICSYRQEEEEEKDFFSLQYSNQSTQFLFKLNRSTFLRTRRRRRRRTHRNYIHILSSIIVYLLLYRIENKHCFTRKKKWHTVVCRMNQSITKNREREREREKKRNRKKGWTDDDDVLMPKGYDLIY